MTPRRDPNEDIIGGEEVPRELELAEERGEQRARIENLTNEVTILRADMSRTRQDISEIKEMLASNKGGIRMLLAVGSIAASLGAGIAEIIHWWHR